MVVSLDKYSLFAEWFRYPEDESIFEKVEESLTVLENEYPDAFETIQPYAEFIRKSEFHQVEEVFNKTFHIQAICYLDLGYVIFGEDYKRGEFLVNMKREQAAANNDCGCELFDNLPNVLTLLPKLNDQSFLDELTVRILIPSLEKMILEFDSAKLSMRKKIFKKKDKVIIQEGQTNGNIYQYALKALLQVLEKDFEGINFDQDQINEENKAFVGDAFVASCGSCGISNVNTQKK